MVFYDTLLSVCLMMAKKTEMIATDGLGSVTRVTDGSGAVAQSYQYTAFGKVTASGLFEQPYSFTGREYDVETGLHYYRARYLDPDSGRFISKDPIGFEAGDPVLYGYVSNNAVNWTDPLGLLQFKYYGYWCGPG